MRERLRLKSFSEQPHAGCGIDSSQNSTRLDKVSVFPVRDKFVIGTSCISCRTQTLHENSFAGQLFSSPDEIETEAARDCVCVCVRERERERERESERVSERERTGER